VERVYLSSPLALYGTKTLKQAIAAVEARYAGAAVLLPSELFRDRGEWLRRSPDVLRTMTRLVVVTEADGWVGRGVNTEVQTALGLARPVEWCPSPGVFIPWSDVHCSDPDATNWTQFVQLSRRTVTE
jgi:hypothetical protein